MPARHRLQRRPERSRQRNGADRDWIHFRKMDAGQELRKYAVFVPYTYESGKRYPAIVFLHGLGEAGDDGHGQLRIGLAPYISRHPEAFPYIAIFPQSSGEWTGDDRAQMVSEIIDEVQRDYSVDPDRITLTGISTGGTGVWLIGARYADRFSALVPMCGYGDGNDVQILAHLPIWMFHNSGDPLVLARFSASMYKKLEEVGADVQYTEYGSFLHDCWHRAYNDSKLWERGSRINKENSGAKSSTGILPVSYSISLDS